MRVVVISMNTDKQIVERLRRNLPTLRRVAGWSAEQLAKLLGVTRATVVTLENTENKMTIMQYLAIRALLDAEIRENDNKVLQATLFTLVDDESASEETRETVRLQTAEAAKRIGTKVGSATLAKEVARVLAKVGELKLSDIPREDLVRGKEKADALLGQMKDSRITWGGEQK